MLVVQLGAGRVRRPLMERLSPLDQHPERRQPVTTVVRAARRDSPARLFCLHLLHLLLGRVHDLLAHALCELLLHPQQSTPSAPPLHQPRHTCRSSPLPASTSQWWPAPSEQHVRRCHMQQPDLQHVARWHPPDARESGLGSAAGERGCGAAAHPGGIDACWWQPPPPSAGAGSGAAAAAALSWVGRRLDWEQHARGRGYVDRGERTRTSSSGCWRRALGVLRVLGCTTASMVSCCSSGIGALRLFLLDLVGPAIKAALVAV